ncbi:hypothetical protein GQ597_09025 [Gilliamella sp. Pra-s65]|uniref:hypothetical protein n=1 Tax=unclassified Gilliamella TaxID=2685620 RepID=UPI001365A972|nr:MULTISPECIES: hypothetical protein [unclassified Gilliamella]MWN90840.1 hypothetical protein [Gilliamella sp. Pra-s65]MWP73779.1 hypothetical protein [Gilliamella sp. Pra-s52]
MSWPKPTIIDAIKAPKPLHAGRWLCFFIILALITSVILALIWSDKNYFSQWAFWFSIVFISVAIGSIAISVRLYLYGLAQEKYEIWQHEQKHIEQNWQEWAMQSLIILDSFYVLPNQLDLNDIWENNESFTSRINKSLAFDSTFDLSKNIEDLFFSMRDMLLLLPTKDPINVTVYSLPESYGLIEKDINDAYRSAKITQPYVFSHHIIADVDIDKLMELIDSSKSSIELIIINNTASSEGAFLCSFLLIDKVYYQDLAINIGKSEVLRPMITSDMPLGVQQMVEMQSKIHQVKQLFLANLDNNQRLNIIKQLAEQKISLELICQLENYVGNQQKASYWLTLALACDITTKTKQNNLIAVMQQNRWLLSVVTALNGE